MTPFTPPKSTGPGDPPQDQFDDVMKRMAENDEAFQREHAELFSVTVLNRKERG